MENGVSWAFHEWRLHLFKWKEKFQHTITRLTESYKRAKFTLWKERVTIDTSFVTCWRLQDEILRRVITRCVRCLRSEEIAHIGDIISVKCSRQGCCHVFFLLVDYFQPRAFRREIWASPEISFPITRISTCGPGNKRQSTSNTILITNYSLNYLYRNNQLVFQELINGNGLNLATSNFDQNKPTKIFAHGWLMDGHSNPTVIDMKNGKF